MERLFIREKIEEKPVNMIEKQKIGVTGMSRGAGVSFVAVSLAKVLSLGGAGKVTFLEVNDSVCKTMPLIYDAIGFDKRFKMREFISVYNEIKSGGSVKGKVNNDEQINWALITPEDVKSWTGITPIEMVRLINNVSGDIIVCDIPACQNAEDYLHDMDIIIYVIDPVPSAMIAGFPFLKEVKRMEHRGKKVVWIVNKFNSGINKRDMHNFLKLKDYYKIPFIDAEHFYSAEYNCKMPYEMSDIRDAARETLEKIIKKELL